MNPRDTQLAVFARSVKSKFLSTLLLVALAQILAWMVGPAASSTNSLALQQMSFTTEGLVHFSIAGPVGASFLVQSSRDLQSWSPIYSGVLSAASEDFTDVVFLRPATAFYRAVLATPPIQIVSVSATGAPPFSILTIAANGFDSAQPLSVRFFDSTGYRMEVAPIAVRSNSISVGVPPYLNLQTREIQAGLVSLEILQTNGPSASVSRAVRGFLIWDLPRPPSTPGMITLNFLQGISDLGLSIQSRLPGTALETAEIRSAVSNYLGLLLPFQNQISNLTQNPAGNFPLATLGASSIPIDSQDLRNLDRSIVGFLQAQADALDPRAYINLSFRQPQSVPGSTEASTYITELLRDPDSAATSTARTAYFNVSSSLTPTAFAISYDIVGGGIAVGIGAALLLGAPLEAVALPTLALLAVTFEGAGGMVALGGALGQNSPGAAKFVQDGVGRLDGLLFSPLKVFLSEAQGGLLALTLGGKAIYEAFGKVSLPPPAISITDVTAPEGQSGTQVFNFVVSLSAPSTQIVSVKYSTASGSADPSDYEAMYDATVTFNPGETQKTVPITVIGDLDVEIDETFSVELYGAQNATIAKSKGTGTIVNDDVPDTTMPTVTITSATIVPGPGGYTYTITGTASGPVGTGLHNDYGYDLYLPMNDNGWYLGGASIRRDVGDPHTITWTSSYVVNSVGTFSFGVYVIRSYFDGTNYVHLESHAHGTVTNTSP